MTIGVFDSGLGGLSVLVELRHLLPDADLHYLGDRSRAPYGRLPIDRVRRFSHEVVSHLVDAGAQMVVIACNAASTAALHSLRRRLTHIPFVGMEPAVRPAAASTRTGVIGVLTTQATFQGPLLASVVERFGSGVTVLPRICAGWVELVEQGTVAGDATEEAVAREIDPLIEAGADTLVIACTHFSFLTDLIRQIAGPGVAVIDPAGPVARQAAKVAADLGLVAGTATLRLEVSGAVNGVADTVARLTGLKVVPHAVTWPPDE